MVGAGRSGGRHLDRKLELGFGRQQNADLGQRGSNSHGRELQDHFRAPQHRQRFSRHGVSKWNGISIPSIPFHDVFRDE